MKKSTAGFTLVELMISIAIITLISTATVFSLRTSRQKEELHTATRLLAGDIRNIQARALTARNILTCETGSGTARVCETENPSADPCATACEPAPPPRFGMEFTTLADGYALFADVEQSDWRLTSENEILLARSLNPLGGAHVVIAGLETDLGTPLVTIPLAVGRQNGIMRLDACGDPGLPGCAPTEPKWLRIILRHQDTNELATVEVNAVTGRVSTE